MAKKIEVFMITFICYTSIHSLRTAYSFSKQSLTHIMGVDKSVIGYVDSMLLMCLGLGHFLHALHPVKSPVKTLWIGTLFCALDYGLIPLLLQRIPQNYSLICLFLLMSINGYLQSYTWPNLLMVIQRYYDPKKQSLALGIWATSANVGNIVGYYMCHKIVTENKYGWQMGMYFAAGFVLLNALIISFRIQQAQPINKYNSKYLKSSKNKQLSAKQKQDLQKQISKHLSIAHVFKDPTIVAITTAFSLIKSVIYGILLWLPLYFHNIGLDDYKTQIPECYDVTCIIGSFFLGWIFKKTSLKGTVLAPLMLILVLLFLGLRYLELSVIGYFLMIGGVGACLGGTFNTMAGLVTMQLAKVVPKQYQNQCLGFFSALTMSVANVTTALTQIIIGYVAKKQQSLIFTLFMVYSLGALLCLMFVSFKQYKQYKRQIRQNDRNKQYSALNNWFKSETIKQLMDKIEMSNKRQMYEQKYKLN